MADGSAFRKTLSVKTFECQGCGAAFLLAPSEISSTCAFCGSGHVLALDRQQELVAPDAILPMKLGQQQAASKLADWLNENGTQRQGVLDKPQPIYLPAWVFDLTGNVPWSGRETDSRKAQRVSGEIPAQFYDLCIPASRSLSELFLRLLPGYILAGAPAYDPRFLSGWPARVYDLPMAEASLEARRLAVEQIRARLQAEHGDLADLQYSTSAIALTACRLFLLPVWVAGWSLAERNFRVLINGQTGDVLGETRHSGVKGMPTGVFGSRPKP